MGRLPRKGARLLQLLQRVGDSRPNRTLSAVAIVVFLLTAWAAWLRLPEVPFQWQWLLWTVGVLVPCVVTLNGVELLFTSRLLGASLSATTAIRLAFFASAANLLPIPGGAFVRVAALKGLGVEYKRGSVVTVLTGGLWLTAAVILAGVGGLATGRTAVGALFLLAGTASSAAVVWLVNRFRVTAGGERGAVVRLFVAEVATAVITAARFWVAVRGLGLITGFPESAAMGVSVVLGALAGFVPAGLGVRELTAAGLASLVRLDPAVGIAAAVADRVAGLIGMALFGSMVLIVGQRSTTTRGADHGAVG